MNMLKQTETIVHNVKSRSGHTRETNTVKNVSTHTELKKRHVTRFTLTGLVLSHLFITYFFL